MHADTLLSSTVVDNRFYNPADCPACDRFQNSSHLGFQFRVVRRHESKKANCTETTLPQRASKRAPVPLPLSRAYCRTEAMRNLTPSALIWVCLFRTYHKRRHLSPSHFASDLGIGLLPRLGRRVALDISHVVDMIEHHYGLACLGRSPHLSHVGIDCPNLLYAGSMAEADRAIAVIGAWVSARIL